MSLFRLKTTEEVFSRDRTGMALQTADSSLKYNKLAHNDGPSAWLLSTRFGAETCTSFVYNSTSLRARAQHTGSAPK